MKCPHAAKKIGAIFFKRTAISRKPEALTRIGNPSAPPSMKPSKRSTGNWSACTGIIGRLFVERKEAQGWGKAVVEQLAADLRTEFPGVGGFSASNLWRMKAFFEAYTGLEKLAQLVREIGWSHNLALLEPCKDTCRHRRTSPFCWRTCEPDGHQRKGTGTDHHLFPRGGGRSVQCDAQDRP